MCYWITNFASQHEEIIQQQLPNFAIDFCPSLKLISPNRPLAITYHIVLFNHRHPLSFECITCRIYSLVWQLGRDENQDSLRTMALRTFLLNDTPFRDTEELFFLLVSYRAASAHLKRNCTEVSMVDTEEKQGSLRKIGNHILFFSVCFYIRCAVRKGQQGFMKNNGVAGWTFC